MYGIVSASSTTAFTPVRARVGEDGLRTCVGVGEEEARLDAQDDHARRLRLGVPRARSTQWPSAGPPEHGDVRPRGAVEQEQQRDADADEQAGQRVEDQHAEQRGERGEEVGPRGRAVDLPEAARATRGRGATSAGMSTSSMTAAITTAASVASGSVSKSPVRNSSVTTVSAATTRPEICVSRAGAAVDGGLRQAAVDDHPAATARRRGWRRRGRSARGWRRSRSARARRRSSPRRGPRRSRRA